MTRSSRAKGHVANFAAGYLTMGLIAAAAFVYIGAVRASSQLGSDTFWQILTNCAPLGGLAFTGALYVTAPYAVKLSASSGLPLPAADGLTFAAFIGAICGVTAAFSGFDFSISAQAIGLFVIAALVGGAARYGLWKAFGLLETAEPRLPGT